MEPLALPCRVAGTCQYASLEEWLITDYSYRKRLTDLEYEVRGLRVQYGRYVKLERALAAFRADLMTATTPLAPSQLLVTLAGLGL